MYEHNQESVDKKQENLNTVTSPSRCSGCAQDTLASMSTTTENRQIGCSRTTDRYYSWYHFSVYHELRFNYTITFTHNTAHRI